MSISAIGGTTSSATAIDLRAVMGKMRGQRPDPAKMLEEMTKNFIQDKDQDGDGALSSSEISGLSAESFTKLDTDGNGVLNQSELVEAGRTHMEAVRKSFESQASSGSSAASGMEAAIDSLSDTPEGELMKMMMPDGPPKPPAGAMSSYQETEDLLANLLAQLQSGSFSSSLASSLNLAG